MYLLIKRKIRLTAKWIPKEGRKNGKWANRIAQKIFPNSSEPNNIAHLKFWLNHVVGYRSTIYSHPKSLIPTENYFELTVGYLADESYYKQHALKSLQTFSFFSKQSFRYNRNTYVL